MQWGSNGNYSDQTLRTGPGPRKPQYMQTVAVFAIQAPYQWPSLVEPKSAWRLRGNRWQSSEQHRQSLQASNFPVAHMVKNLLAMQETQVRSLGWEDPLEKGMETHSSILTWEIPRTEEPGGLQSMGSQTVGHDWATKHNLWLLIQWTLW